MLDGALIQMSYEFSNSSLQRHRLAFLPSPVFGEFETVSPIYLDDDIPMNINMRNVVPFPWRFDYDTRDENFSEIVHPKSHLTLGQYPNCRIPLTSPMTPVRFLDFVIRNFYDGAQSRYLEHLPRDNCSFGESIFESERKLIHIVVPS